MRQQVKYTLLDEAKATGVGRSAFVQDFRHKQIAISTDGMGAGDSIVVEILGSIETEVPDFSAAIDVDNQYEPIQIIGGEDGATIDGDTKVTIADADDTQIFAINADGYNWITAKVTTISDAVNSSVTVKLRAYND